MSYGQRGRSSSSTGRYPRSTGRRPYSSSQQPYKSPYGRGYVPPHNSTPRFTQSYNNPPVHSRNQVAFATAGLKQNKLAGLGNGVSNNNNDSRGTSGSIGTVSNPIRIPDSADTTSVVLTNGGPDDSGSSSSSSCSHPRNLLQSTSGNTNEFQRVLQQRRNPGDVNNNPWGKPPDLTCHERLPGSDRKRGKTGSFSATFPDYDDEEDWEDYEDFSDGDAFLDDFSEGEEEEEGDFEEEDREPISEYRRRGYSSSYPIIISGDQEGKTDQSAKGK